MWPGSPLEHILRKKKPYARFVTTAADNTNLTTYTFSSVALGKPDPSRLIVVAAHAEDGTTTFTLSSGTVDGVASTLVITGAPAATIVTGLLQTANITQETADITITWSEPVTSCAIGVFALYNLKSQTVRFSSEDVQTGAISLPPRTAAFPQVLPDVLYIAAGSNVGGETATWTVADGGMNILECYDADSAELGYSGAIVSTPNAVRGGGNVELSWSGAGNGDGVLAGWM